MLSVKCVKIHIYHIYIYISIYIYIVIQGPKARVDFM